MSDIFNKKVLIFFEWLHSPPPPPDTHTQGRSQSREIDEARPSENVREGKTNFKM